MDNISLNDCLQFIIQGCFTVNEVTRSPNQKILLNKFLFFTTMAAPIFGKKWYEKSPAQQKQAMDQFLAAVSTSRSGSDESIKQVMNC